MTGTDELRPPFLAVPGLPNIRDTGGYPVASQAGYIVKQGIVFRSAEPSRLTEDGVRVLQNLGITHVYDLRSSVELERFKAAGRVDLIKEWPGAKRVPVPVFQDQDYGPEAIAVRYKNYSHDGTEGFIKAYSDILRTAADPNHPYTPFRTILMHLATPESPSPLLVHCTAGKDRTGVICAIILSLCDVDDHVIAHEYSLTEIGLRERRAEIIEHLINTEAMKGDTSGAERMISSRKEAMLGTLELIRQQYGSVYDYVRNECRVPEAAIERIRSNLVVQAAPDEEHPRLDQEAKHLL